MTPESPPTASPRPNLPTPTGGGRQLWLDVAMRGGWRVQRHLVTGHHRLLDEADVRRAWGSEAACLDALEAARRDGLVRFRSRRLCLLLHGYVRTKNSFSRLKRALEADGLQVYDPNLPTMRMDVPQLVQAVQHLIALAEPDFDRIDVVTHSLGGILARHAMAQRALPGGGLLIMMAPPNQGSLLAQRILDTRRSLRGRVAGAVVDAVFGRTLSQLGTRDGSWALGAPVPGGGIGITVIAGTHAPWYLPLGAKDGDSDGIVTVAETRMPDGEPVVTVPACHTFIMNHDATLAEIRRRLGQAP